MNTSIILHNLVTAVRLTGHCIKSLLKYIQLFLLKQLNLVKVWIHLNKNSLHNKVLKLFFRENLQNLFKDDLKSTFQECTSWKKPACPSNNLDICSESPTQNITPRKEACNLGRGVKARLCLHKGTLKLPLLAPQLIGSFSHYQVFREEDPVSRSWPPCWLAAQ